MRISRRNARSATPREIVDYAEDHEIDQIVMGSHGRTGATRLLLGSVAELVVRRVTVVRDETERNRLVAGGYRTTVTGTEARLTTQPGGAAHPHFGGPRPRPRLP